MNLKEYQTQAITFRKYDSSKVVIYPALGLAGEVGEAVELVKKWFRHSEPDDSFDDKHERLEKLRLELGDVLWYLSVLAFDVGLSLEDIAKGNIEKLTDRQKHGKR